SLAISDMVRGSVGFILEEDTRNQELVDTAVKNAIDDVAEIIALSATERTADFEAAAERLEPRMMVGLRDFFRTLDDKEATERIVEGTRYETLDAQAVDRARKRVEAIDIQEEESDNVIGELLGLLPDARRFEMKLADSGDVIRG